MGPSSSSPSTYPRGPTDAGTPVCPGDARRETQPSHRAGVSVPTLVSYLPEVTKGAPARRQCRMIAGAAAETAVLPLAVPLAACGPPSGNPETARYRFCPQGRSRIAYRHPGCGYPRRDRDQFGGSGITRPLAST